MRRTIQKFIPHVITLSILMIIVSMIKLTKNAFLTILNTISII